MTQWLKRSPPKSPPVQPPEPAEQHEQHEQDDAEMQRLPVLAGFDAQAALKRLGGGVDQYLRFIKLYRDRNQDALDHLRAELRRGDLVAARRLVHSIKGSAATIGAVELQNAALDYECELIKASQDDDLFTPLLSDLEKQWQAAMHVLETIK